MRRLLMVLVAAAGLAGCTAMGGTGDGSLDPMDATPRAYDFEESAFSKVGNALLSVPATAVWWPYKIVTSAGRGAYDGIAGGMQKAPMPIVGLITSPITGAAGVVNGTFRGIGRGPAYVSDTEEMGRAFGSTLKEPIPLWRDQR
jgi:hypothetical protein